MGKMSFSYDEDLRRILISFPLTSPTGNVRVRRRGSSKEYGYQVYKDEIKDSSCYIDWQIEYDTKKESESHSRLSFVRSINHDSKFFYCLSDFIKFFYESGDITNADLISIRDDLNTKTDSDFIISNSVLITKQFREKLNCRLITISEFEMIPYSTVFPLYLTRLEEGIDVEIGLYEGGFATSSLMPHLYVCIPFSSLSNFDALDNRVSARNDHGDFIIDAHNINIFLKILHLTGLLTSKHKSDVIDIINRLLAWGYKNGILLEVY